MKYITFTNKFIFKKAKLNFAEIATNDSENYVIDAVMVPFNVMGNGVKFDPKSFDEWSKDAPSYPVFLNHDQSKPLGYLDNSKYSITDNGLEGSMVLYRENSDVKNLRPFIESGLLDSVSIGATVDEWGEDDTEQENVILKSSLRELSVVWNPAFKEALMDLSEKTRTIVNKFTDKFDEDLLLTLLRDYEINEYRADSHEASAEEGILEYLRNK